ncbi:R3H domain-containing protein 1 [Mortierella hygrophila]|uniref:R3H domain-containing protein 1 n=1 Tax=Mortierella hygrophila TaxID=979708 RepID=A0A9P6FFV9_9FUNG|nr:R3H domain-containing protein 1 [Mortierella hygrophila]
MQANDALASQEPVTKLTKALEGLEVEEECNDAQDMALDEFLVNALKNRQERIFLLKLDREFCSFINNPSQPQLEFPTLNGYYRMMVHKVANYFKLTRIVDPSQKIILFKTESSAIPPLRISDLAEEEDEQPVKMMKVLKRNPGRSSSGSATPDGSSEPERKPMSIKEREEAYAKARARIFQEDVPAKPKSPSESSDPIVPVDSPSTTAVEADPPSREGNDESPHGANRTRPSNGKKSVAGSRHTDDQDERDGRQPSLPNSCNVSRSTSPSPSVTISNSDPNARQSGKGLRPKAKQSKTDLAAECADVRRRKSTTSNASSSSGTVKTPVGLARTISSSSSQDGFQSPNSGMTLTESPTVNSPSNGTPSKGYDYFAPNPNSNSGSVSPMSNGLRASYTYPQPGGHKQQRNFNGPATHNGGGPGGMGYNNAQSNSGFMKGMNTPAFVPKKPYPKHGQVNNHQNAGPYNNGPMPGYPSGPSNQPHAFNNNNNGNNHYTQQPHPSPASPWSDRSGPPGQDGPNFYVQQDAMHGSSSQPPPQGFNYSNAPNQFSQPGPSMHLSYNSQHQYHQHHPSSNHPNSHHASQRGGRRNQSTQPYYQHHNHPRTNPQMHNPQQHPPHHGGNFNGPPPRDDFTYNQGPQSSMRYSRGYDGNPNHPPSQQYAPDFYPTHGMPVDPPNGPNMYPGFQGHQISPGEGPQNGQRYPFHHKGPYDANWGQGPGHPTGQGYDQSNTLYNPAAQPQGGKKPYKNYHSIPAVNQQQFSSTMGGPQNVMSQALPGAGPGGISGNGAISHYDIERRPPKSAELFDPNGPQPSSGSGGGGSQGEFGNSGRYQGTSDGGYMSGQDGPTMGGERQPQGHRGSLHGQYQSQSGAHYNQTTFQPTHAPIAMNRSYSSSSSSAGYSGGNTSSPGPHAGKKNHSLLYDYSVTTQSYDGNVKSTTAEADKAPAPALGHILEIFGYDAQDDIFEDLALPAGSKVRRLKAANKEVLGQVLVVFKNATLASEALSTFQEGKSTWMNSEAKLHFDSTCLTSEEGEGAEATGSEEGESEESSKSAAAALPSTRLQRRFNVKVWTPVLVNSVTPLKATQPQLSSSPSNDSTNNNNNNAGSASSNGTARSEDGEERDQEDVVNGTSSSAAAVATAVSSSSPTLQKESDPGSVILGL